MTQNVYDKIVTELSENIALDLTNYSETVIMYVFKTSSYCISY